MITVLDQARPWLTPSRTLAAMIQLHDRRPDEQQWHRQPNSQPATRIGLRP
jgi:hypothetical protein